MKSDKKSECFDHHEWWRLHCQLAIELQILAPGYIEKPLSSATILHNVPSSFPLVAVGHPSIQPYALLHETCAGYRLCVVLKLTNLVDICICRDFDRVVRGV